MGSELIWVVVAAARGLMQRNNREELFIRPKEKWYQLVSKRKKLVLLVDAHIYDTFLDVLISIYMVALNILGKTGRTNNQTVSDKRLLT